VTLDQIFEQWQQDCNVDKEQISVEATKIAALHYKYFKILSYERQRLKALQLQYKSDYKDAYETYMHGPSKEQVKNGFEPPRTIIVKKDVDVYLDADKTLQKSLISISVQEEKIALLQSIIQTIANRTFQLRAVIDWEKFKAGL